ARDAVPTHFDEEIFLERWPTLVAGRLDSRPPPSRRQDERIVARYAGQPPKRILRQVRLATQLAADIYAGSYNPSGDFADHAHYIRVVRALTGRTPASWVRSRACRSGWHGEPVAAAYPSHTSRGTGAPSIAPARSCFAAWFRAINLSQHRRSSAVTPARSSQRHEEHQDEVDEDGATMKTSVGMPSRAVR